MKEDIRNLTVEEFWQKYSKDYENGKGMGLTHIY